MSSRQQAVGRNAMPFFSKFGIADCVSSLDNWYHWCHCRVVCFQSTIPFVSCLFETGQQLLESRQQDSQRFAAFLIPEISRDMKDHIYFPKAFRLTQGVAKSRFFDWL